MSSAKLTLIGLEEYMQSKDSSLFSGFVLPAGIDEDLAINQILSRGGEWEVIYSNPLLIQSQVGYWCRRWERTFTKWINALNVEYDPLYNYDRHEEWEDERHNKQDGKDTNDLTTTNDLKTATNTNVTTETERSAFDSSDYQPLTKETITGDEDDNYTKDTGTIKNTGDVKRENKEDETGKHKGRMYGNIGVTTSQQMLEAELEIAKWNIYEHIADIFLSEFTIPLYT